MNRRIRKARQLRTDIPLEDVQGVISDVGDFLDAAAVMVEETETRPKFEDVLVLDEPDDEIHKEILDAHVDGREGTEKPVGR